MSTTIKISESFKEELNGRILFFIDRVDSPSEEPMLYKRNGLEGRPLFGVTFYGLQGGDEINLDEQKENIIGWPFKYDDIPHGKLQVQAFFMRYHKYTRKDGHVIWGMADNGGGGDFSKAAYNMYSDVKTVDYGNEDFTLVIDKMIEPEAPLKDGEVLSQGNYVSENKHVKYFKMKSELLSDFWGEDVYVGANILLPKGYSPKKKYPIVYCQGHFPGKTAPFRYDVELRDREKGLTEFWDSGKAPKVICVNFRDANMYYDDSYKVNSENLGPYGDALVTEIIPAIEKQFGGTGVPEGRILCGGSTGGWVSMALQLFYPDFFGGSWPGFCDGMDFHCFQLINMYDEDNVYELEHNWRKVERPGCRDTKGNVVWTMREENYYELAVGGDLAHGLGQMGIFQAVYCPVGEDGYPKYAYDPVTGKINKDVVKYWEEHYDLTAYIERNHEWLMPKIRGKIHLRGGDMDNFYLNLGHYAITEVLEKYDYQGYSYTFPRVGHDGNITIIDMLGEIGEYLKKINKKSKKK